MPYSDTDEEYDVGVGPPMSRQVYDWYQQNASPIGDRALNQLNRGFQSFTRIPQNVYTGVTNALDWAGKNVAAPALGSMADVAETDWSQQPFIGSMGEQGEFTGRLPALASYIAPYITPVAAPANSLTAGVKLPGWEHGYPENLVGAFHGTPHRFAPTPENVLGQFDPKFYRRGTGGLSEGAGFYLASQRGLGKEYQHFTTGGHWGDIPLTKEGKPILGMDLSEKYYEPGQIVPIGGSEYGRVERFYKPTSPANAKYWRAEIRPVTLSDKAIEQGFTPTKSLHDPKLWDDLAKDFVIRREEPIGSDVDLVSGARGWEIGTPGNLYHVEIKPPEESIMHWNKRFSEQTPEVQLALKEGWKKHGYGDNRIADLEASNPTGKDIYNSMVEDHSPRPWAIEGDPELTKSKVAVSKTLDEAGIPGLKYHDDYSMPNIVYNGKLIHESPDSFVALGLPRGGVGKYEPRAEGLTRVLHNDGDIDKAIKDIKADIVHAKEDPDHLQWIGTGLKGKDWTSINGLEESVKWLEQNRNKISRDISHYNHNYVIFDSRHLNIIHRENHLKGVGRVI